MGLNIGWDAVLFFALGLLLLYGLGWLLLVPLRTVLRLIGNALLGGAALWVIGLLQPLTGLSVAINPFTALAVGILGVPGAALVVALTAFFQ